MLLRRWVLPMCMFVLSLFSLVTLKSVAPTLLSKQVIFFIVGAGVFFVTSNISFHTWVKRGPVLYGSVIGLLIITRIIGTVTRGATSWIPLGSFHVEPSQLAVVLTGLLLTDFLAKHPIQTISDAIKPILIASLPAFLIFIQPDLGTTTIYAISIASIFFLSRTKVSLLVYAFVGAVIVILLGWNVVLRPYQKDRITSFLNVEQNQTGAGYNAMQSVIAVGSGMEYGRGIGQGVQSHLRFLPERQTDFVFASFAEETGFLGSAPLLFLYATQVFFILFVGLTTKTEAARLFCFMTATMIAVQSGINMGMNMGLLPITGITLPFFSYGGSSILSLCFQYGCVQSILREFRKKEVLHLR